MRWIDRSLLLGVQELLSVGLAPLEMCNDVVEVPRAALAHVFRVTASGAGPLALELAQRGPGGGRACYDLPVTSVKLLTTLRDALVSLLSVGTWGEIEALHARVSLGWRADLKPGQGKPQYVEAVLSALSSDELLALGERCRAGLPPFSNPG